MIIGAQKVLSDLERFERIVNRDAERFALEFKQSVQREMVISDSIDTGRMITSIDYWEGIVSDGHHFIVGSGNDEVTYDGFVEFGHKTRGGGFVEGRPNYEKGIQRADIRSVFDRMMNESFVI